MKFYRTCFLERTFQVSSACSSPLFVLKTPEYLPGYTESGSNPIVRTYTNYPNANGVLISGTDSLTAPPPPQNGSMDMEFSGGSVGSLVRLRLNMTIPASGPRVCTLCKLDETDVTEEAQGLFDQ